jgi:hypothetical protein
VGELDCLLGLRSEILRAEGDVFLNGLFEELIFRELEDKADFLPEILEIPAPSLFDGRVHEVIDRDVSRGRIQ